jgi:hypothetical protein
MKYNIKHHKLQYKHRPCSNSMTGLRKIPLLTLSGNWLKDAGFTFGRQIEIRVSRKRLMIKAV